MVAGRTHFGVVARLGTGLLNIYRRHWTSRVAHALADFYLRHWQFVWTFGSGVVALILAYLALNELPI
jgi:hypothetical protein